MVVDIEAHGVVVGEPEHEVAALGEDAELEASQRFLNGLLPHLVGDAKDVPGVGVISAPVQARGTLGESQIVNSKSGVHLKAKGSADIVTQQIVIGGGGHTGWHSHPGPVLVTVKVRRPQAHLRQRRSCTGACTRRATASSTGATPSSTSPERVAVEQRRAWATYFVPGAPGAAFRLDAAGRNRLLAGDTHGRAQSPAVRRLRLGGLARHAGEVRLQAQDRLRVQLRDA